MCLMTQWQSVIHWCVWSKSSLCSRRLLQYVETRVSSPSQLHFLFQYHESQTISTLSSFRIPFCGQVQGSTPSWLVPRHNCYSRILNNQSPSLPSQCHSQHHFSGLRRRKVFSFVCFDHPPFLHFSWQSRQHTNSRRLTKGVSEFT